MSENLLLVSTQNGTVFIGEVTQLSNRILIKNAFEYEGYNVGRLLNGENQERLFLQKLPTCVVVDNSKIEFTCPINYEWQFSYLFEVSK